MHSPLAAVAPALAAVRTRWRGPLGAYPEIGDGGDVTVSPAQLAAQAREWIAAGAQIVGGCCGTTPQHIGALAPAQGGNGIGPTSFGT
jgi:homocysteine S-methyltransferase